MSFATESEMVVVGSPDAGIKNIIPTLTGRR